MQQNNSEIQGSPAGEPGRDAAASRSSLPAVVRLSTLDDVRSTLNDLIKQQNLIIITGITGSGISDIVAKLAKNRSIWLDIESYIPSVDAKALAEPSDDVLKRVWVIAGYSANWAQLVELVITAKPHLAGVALLHVTPDVSLYKQDLQRRLALGKAVPDEPQDVGKMTNVLVRNQSSRHYSLCLKQLKGIMDRHSKPLQLRIYSYLAGGGWALAEIQATVTYRSGEPQHRLLKRNRQRGGKHGS